MHSLLGISSSIHLISIFSITATLTFGTVNCTPATIGQQAKVTKGQLDLSNWDFIRNPIMNLSGEWNVEVLQKRKWPNFSNGTIIDFPILWNDKKVKGLIPNHGVVAYRSKIILPETKRTFSLNIPLIYCAYELYLNGKLFASKGSIGFTAAEEIPAIRQQYVIIPSGLNKIDIILVHSAYNFRTGGIWSPLEIGTTEFIANRSGERTMADFSVFGYVLVMLLYHLVLYFLRPTEKSTLFFSLCCVAIILRILVSSSFTILKIFPDLTFTTLLRLDYLSMPWGVIAGSLFVHSIFPNSFKKKLLWIFAGISILFVLLILFTGPHIFSQASITLQGIVGLYLLTAFFAVIHASVKKTQGAKTFITGYIILFAGYLNDVLQANRVIDSIPIQGITFCLFFFSQAILISMRFSAAFKRSEELGENLIATNAAYSRFVPRTFLENLGHSDISQVKLGDQVQKEMTILFSDIRSFTTLSENMTPQENFNFLNSYLKRMSPVIQQHNGFIDKYIGDAIMALFPKTGEDGLKAAIGMMTELSTYNAHRGKQNYAPVEIGVGLHTGRLILGTIGSDDRMDGTVISDSVNLASRVEGLTKFYGASIVISEATFATLNDPTLYQYRVLDRVVVKGKSDSVTMFEIFNGLPEAKIDLLLKTKGNFERGINYYMLEQFQEAETSFRLVLLDSPTDKAAEIYLKRCTYYIEHGVPENWEAITNLDHK